MASVDMLHSTKQGHVLFYDLDDAVGPGAPNKRDDVLLVQYMMREVPKSGRFAPEPFPAPLMVDGAPGPNLFANIKHFQALVKQKHGAAAAQDGRIDPVPGASIRAASGVQYNIVTLNFAYQVSRPSEYPFMAKADDCPNDLRTPLTPKFIVNPT